MGQCTVFVSCIVCSYGGERWISVVMGGSSNCLVRFMYPEGRSPSFHWSQDDICWVKIEGILKVIKKVEISQCSSTNCHTARIKPVVDLLQ